MGMFEDLSNDVFRFMSGEWTAQDAYVVPEASALRLGNHAKTLTAVVLYADISDSTLLVDKYKPQLVAAMFKAFLHCAARIVKSEGGEIVSYDGDRIMAVYIGDNMTHQAVRSALRLNHSIANIVNKNIKYQLNSGYELKHVVGIDAGKLFVSRIGVRGDNDLVWIGSPANYAAKMSSFNGYKTYITERALMRLSVDYRERFSWQRLVWTPYVGAEKINIYATNELMSLS